VKELDSATADEARGIWPDSRGGQGDATGTDNWQANGLLLQPGLNILTVTAEDLAGNLATDTLAVTRSPGDGDQDGLLDAWEILYFGTLIETPSGDPDSDGQSTGSEYATGTNPASGASTFAAGTRRHLAQPAGAELCRREGCPSSRAVGGGRHRAGCGRACCGDLVC
jgi:hypothetical protein